MGSRRVGRSALLAVATGSVVLAASAPAGAVERKYELVTPFGSTANIRPDNSVAAPDGNHVCFVSPDPIVEGQTPVGGTSTLDAYCAHRSAGGWVTEWITQPAGAVAPGTHVGAAVKFVSLDGSRKAFLSDLKHVAGLPTTPASESELRDGYLREGSTTTLITGMRTGPGQDHKVPLGATPTLSHILFDHDGMAQVWTAGGPQVVSRDAGPAGGAPVPGHVPIGDRFMVGSFDFNDPGLALPGAISPDGSKIFFEATGDLVAAADDDGSGQDVYVRENATTTKLVSPRRASGGPAAGGNVWFAGASDSGDIVYLLSSGQLNDDPWTGAAGEKLYRYTISTNELKLVTGGLDQSSQFMDVPGLQVSRDGSSVFFVATLSGSDGRSLYVARGGTVTRIIGLAAGDVSDVYAGDGNRVGQRQHAAQGLRVSHNGAAAVFRAEADTPGTVGIYRWTAGSGLEVVSKDASGQKVPAQMSIWPKGQAYNPLSNGYYGLVMTDDAQTVFFETPSALVPADINGKWDVYEWRNGEISLVTTGTSGSDAHYFGSSADGGSVFFTTYDRVLPDWDTNAARDVYVARVDGGFSPPAPSSVGTPPAGVGPAGAVGLTGASAPATSTLRPTGPREQAPPKPASSGGEEDAAARPRARVRQARVSSSGTSARVRISVSTPGRLKVSLVQRGGRADGKRIASATRTLRRGGSVWVTLRLPKSVREALKRGERVRVSLSLTLSSRTGDDVDVTRRLTLGGGSGRR